MDAIQVPVVLEDSSTDTSHASVVEEDAPVPVIQLAVAPEEDTEVVALVVVPSIPTADQNGAIPLSVVGSTTTNVRHRMSALFKQTSARRPRAPSTTAPRPRGFSLLKKLESRFTRMTLRRRYVPRDSSSDFHA